MTTGPADDAHGDVPLYLDGPELAEELARRKHVRPIRSADDLACDGIFETDEELRDFLEDTYEARRSSLA